MSESAISFQKALIVASGPAMLEKIVRPLKDEGLAVNACESLDDAKKLYRDQALIILPLKEESREQTKAFIAWLRESAHPPYVLAVGRCDEKYRQSVVASFQLNDLITLPYTEDEVRDRLSSYRHWCRLPDRPARGEMPRAPSAANLSFFSGTPTALNKEEESPETTYCREAPVGIAMFDRQFRYLYANPRWEQQFNLKENVIGRTQFEVFPSLHPDWAKIYQNCLNGETRRGKETVPSSEGAPTEMRWEVRPWRYRTGQIGGIAIAFEEAWQGGETTAAAPPISESPPLPESVDLDAVVVVLDRKGLIQEANAAARKLARSLIVPGETEFETAFPSENREFLQQWLAWDGAGSPPFNLASLEPFTPKDGPPGFLAWSNSAKGQKVTRVGVSLLETALPARPSPLPIPMAPAGVMLPRDEGAEEPEALGESDVDLDEMPELIWRADESGEMKFFNQAWLAFRGRPIDRELNGGWLDGLHASDASKTRAAIAQAVQDRAPAEFTFRLKSAEGDFHRLRMWVRPADRREGAGLIGICRFSNPSDTAPVALLSEIPTRNGAAQDANAEALARAEKAETELMKARRELAMTRDQFEARVFQEKTFSHSPAVLWGVNARGELTFVNRQWERFRGKKLEEDGPDAWLDDVPNPSERAKLRRQLQEAAEEGMAVKTRFHLRDAAGQPRMVELHATPVLDTEGLSKGLSGTLRDVTDEASALNFVTNLLSPGATPLEGGQSTAELFTDLSDKLPSWRSRQDELINNAKTFREIFDQVSVGIVLLGPRGETEFANQRFGEILGFGLRDTVDFEGWLRRGCPDPDHLREVLRVWQQDVWPRQLTKVLTLTNSEGAPREVEIQPQLFLSDNRLLLTVADVTESKRGEEALRDSEIRFRALFRDSAIGIALIDSERKVYDSNPALERIVRQPKRQLIRSDFDDFIHPEDLPRKQALLDQLLTTPKRSGSVELRLKGRAEGDEDAWVRLHVSLVRDTDQRVLFTAYFVHDITEQKQVQAQLQVSQEQNRALLEAIPDLIMLVDRNGVIIDFLPSENVPIDASDQETIGSRMENLLPPFAGQLTRLIEEAYRLDDVVHFRYDAKDGGVTKRFDARIVACKPNNAVVTVQDVTDRQQLSDGIRLQAMGFANSPDAAVVANYRGEIIEWNPAAQAMFGYSKAEASSMSVPDLFQLPNMEAFTRQLAEDGQGGRWEGKLRYSRKDGSSALGEVVYQPLKSPVGALSGQAVFIRPPRDAGPPLEDVRAEIKAETLARMVPQMHERLCANLQIIGTLLNLQFKTQRDPEARSALQTSRNRVRALTLLHDIIRTREDEEAVNFRRFAENLAEELLSSYDAIDRVTINLQIQGAPLDLHVATPLALILNELLTNAIVHAFPETQPGTVWVHLETRGEHGHLSVRDNGPGARSSTAKGPRIPGLGLHIAQNLAKQIGGALEKVDAAETQYRVHFSTLVRK